MDWNLAIERNREALKRILAMLVAMTEVAGLTSPLGGKDGPVRQGEAEPPAGPGEGVRPVLPRHLHRAILRLLRPTESAMRRLIIVMARGLVVTLARPRKARPRPTILRNEGGLTGVASGFALENRRASAPTRVRPSAAGVIPAPRSAGVPLDGKIAGSLEGRCSADPSGSQQPQLSSGSSVSGASAPSSRLRSRAAALAASFSAFLAALARSRSLRSML